MVSSPTRERCLVSNHAAGLQKRVPIFALSASIVAQLPLNGGGRLSRSPTAATAAAGPRRRPNGCCSSSQRLPLATRGVRTRVWGRVVHRLDAGRAQRPPVGAARASEAVALWAFRGRPIASRSSATLTLGDRRYAREYFSDLFCMTWVTRGGGRAVVLRRGELLGPWDRCRTHPRASPDTFARRPSWRPMFDDQSSGRRGQRSAHGPRARGGCGVCLARRRGRVNSRRSSRSADLERRAGPPPGPAGAPYGPRGAREA